MSEPGRDQDLDIFRGLLVVIMLLGHANLLLNSLRPNLSNEGISSVLPWVHNADGVIRLLIHGVAVSFSVLSGYTCQRFLSQRQASFFIWKGLVLIGLDLSVNSLGWRLAQVLNGEGFLFVVEAFTVIGASLLLYPIYRGLSQKKIALIATALLLISKLGEYFPQNNGLLWSLFFQPSKLGSTLVVYSLLNWIPVFMFGVFLAKSESKKGSENCPAPCRSGLFFEPRVLEVALVGMVVFQIIFLKQHPDVKNIFQTQYYPPSTAYLFFSVLWLFAIFSFALWMRRRQFWSNSLFIHFGQNGILYYCVHPYFYSLSNYLLKLKPGPGGFGTAVLFWTIMVVVSYLVSHLRFKKYWRSKF